LSRRPDLLAVIAFTVIAVLPGCVFVYAAVAQRTAFAHAMFHDDAYYYFTIARNLAAGRGPTFNGLDRTNGFHPLWLAVLSALAFVVRGRDAFLVGVAVVEGAAWAIAVRQLERIGQALRRPVPALFAGAALVGIGAINLRLSFNGMESVVVVVVLLALTRTWIGNEDQPTLALGLLLALLVLSRLDMAFLAGGLLVLRLWSMRTSWPRVLSLEVAPLAGALAAYMIASDLYFGTPVPVSGQVKSLGAPFLNPAPIRSFLEAGAVGHRPLWLGLTGFVMTVVAALLIRRDRELTARWGSTLRLVGGVWMGFVAWIGYLTVFTPGSPPVWYFTPLAVTVPFPLAVLVDVLATTGALLTRALGVALVAIGSFMVVGLLTGPGRDASIGDPFVETAPTNAALLATTLRGRGVLAMGDRAGALAYESKLPFVQLEGLVGSNQFSTPCVPDGFHGSWPTGR